MASGPSAWEGGSTFDLVVWGDPSFDTIVVPLAEVVEDQRMPALISDHLGGSGANVAAQAAELGLSVGLVGAVGRDEVGAKVVEQLERSGVRGLMVQCKTTRRTISISGRGGTRTMFGEDSDQYEASYASVEEEWKRSSAKVVHLSLTSVMRSSTDWSVECTNSFRRHGSEVSLDLGNAPELAARGGNWVDGIMQLIRPRVVFANEHEIGHLRDVSRETLAGVEVVIKQGGAVASVVVDGTVVTELLPSKVADVVDTTGAGDVFTAGYLLARLAGVSYDQRLGFAHLTASWSIRSHGAGVAPEHLDEVLAVRPSAVPPSSTPP